jgi:hypothetical protein
MVTPEPFGALRYVSAWRAAAPPAPAGPARGEQWTGIRRLGVQFPECFAWQHERVTINERMDAWRRERRVLKRVSRAAWRLDQAERERTWALASARAEGISIRTLATAVGLSPSRVHQLVAILNAGWQPAPPRAPRASTGQRARVPLPTAYHHPSASATARAPAAPRRPGTPAACLG